MQAKELHNDEKQENNYGQAFFEEVLRFLPFPYTASRDQSLAIYRGVSSSNWLELRTPNPAVAGSNPA
jgi:hypothetical protein